MITRSIIQIKLFAAGYYHGVVLVDLRSMHGIVLTAMHALRLGQLRVREGEGIPTRHMLHLSIGTLVHRLGQEVLRSSVWDGWSLVDLLDLTTTLRLLSNYEVGTVVVGGVGTVVEA